jgi:hypothetical protein
LLLATTLAAASCVTTTPDAAFGVAPGAAGFVPARTAILPCHPWPSGARFKTLPLTSLNDAGVQELCTKLDAYVVASFDNQPYMKAFSPKFVVKALETAHVENDATAIARLFARDGDKGQDATSPPAYYAASPAERPEWTAWVANAASAAKNADALLMPFVLYGDERRYDDRGLIVAERQAGVALLLVATATGKLIWSGGREAAVPTKRLGRAAEPPPMPAWDLVLERLLTEDLWRDYPGRQVF